MLRGGFGHIWKSTHGEMADLRGFEAQSAFVIAVCFCRRRVSWLVLDLEILVGSPCNSKSSKERGLATCGPEAQSVIAPALAPKFCWPARSPYADRVIPLLTSNFLHQPILLLLIDILVALPALLLSFQPQSALSLPLA